MQEIIINADDFGMSVEVNKAIELCFQKGLINQTTIMVNTPFFDDAFTRAKNAGFFSKVGLHLNLVEGEPLTEAIKDTSLCDSNGFFNGSIMKKKINRFILGSKAKEAVSLEIETQIKKYLQTGFTLGHMDSHQHSHTNPSVFPILVPIASKNGILSMRLSRNIPVESISGAKSLYKQFLNHKIYSFNQRSNRYNSILYFGSLDDYDAQYADGKAEKCEIEMHPILINDTLEDAVLGYSITEWMGKRK